MKIKFTLPKIIITLVLILTSSTAFCRVAFPLEKDLPVKYELGQNFPNPFNPVTTISFSIPEDGYVSLKVYNILGKVVGSMVEGYKTAGKYFVKFDGSSLPGGIYFYSLEAGNFRQTRRFILLK